MKILETTLCLPIKDNKILLGKKKRGFGKGKYNGFGGKLNDGETVEEGIIRETKEEANIIPTKYEKVGVLDFDEYIKNERTKLRFYLYITSEWDSEIEETDEMIPEWFDINNIPYDSMFPYDKYWLPMVLEGKKIKAHFNFDKDWNLVSRKIDEIFEDKSNNKGNINKKKPLEER